MGLEGFWACPFRAPSAGLPARVLVDIPCSCSPLLNRETTSKRSTTTLLHSKYVPERKKERKRGDASPRRAERATLFFIPVFIPVYIAGVSLAVSKQGGGQDRLAQPFRCKPVKTAPAHQQPVCPVKDVTLPKTVTSTGGTPHLTQIRRDINSGIK